MRSSTILILLLFYGLCSIVKTIKDEDFSEFDDFDRDEFDIESPPTTVATPLPSKTQSNKPESTNDQEHSQSKPTPTNEDDVTIDDDDDDSMFDEEEFESSDPYVSSTSSSPELKIPDVPAYLIGNRWEAYYCEIIMIITLLGYFTNYLVGRSKNSHLATIVYNSQHDLLERNFSLVGDNGQTNTTQSDEQITTMQKESENLYILWCSGRTSLDSMLIELRLIKRQCVFNSLAALIKSINDTIVYTIDFNKDDLETFVFCLARKRCAAKLHRDMIDLSQFCGERKNADKRGLNGSYQIMSELGGEVSSVLVDKRIADFTDKFPDALEYIHISDQYTGMKAQNGEQQSTTTNSSNPGSATQQQDALNTNERSVRRVLIVAFNLIPQNGRSLQVTIETSNIDYLRFVLHLIDRINSFRLTSKESKTKAVKNRQRVQEQFFKSVNQQRQELAQQRREEQRRAEKEKIMQSNDSELQRKWEEKEQKREKKRHQPKMKQMKIKA